MEYTRKKISDNLFLVLSPDGEVIANHNNLPFPPLSAKMSNLLCDDLNDILQSKRKKPTKKQSSVSPINPKLSFTYCFLSTMMGAGDCNFELELDVFVPEDRLFNLNPGPPLLVTEIIRTEKARSYFGLDHHTLEVDFAHLGKAESVAGRIIAKAKSLVDNMLPCERFVVNFLLHYIDGQSITLCILWVAGILSDEEFIAGYWAFIYYEDVEDLNKRSNKYKDSQSLVSRFQYLRTAVDLYKLEKNI